MGKRRVIAGLDVAFYNKKARIERYVENTFISNIISQAKENGIECPFSVQQLIILWNGKSIGSVGAQLICQHLIDAKAQLNAITLTSNWIGDDGAIAFAKLIKTMEHKTGEELVVHIDFSGIGHDGAVAFSDPEVLKHITVLSLSLNDIRDEAAVRLANGIAFIDGGRLQHLDLDMCNIQDDGATALANMLHSNSTMQTLQLSSNQIGDKGAEALASALKVNQSLVKIELFRNNEITRQGGEELYCAFPFNPSLQTIGLKYDIIPEEYLDCPTSETGNYIRDNFAIASEHG